MPFFDRIIDVVQGTGDDTPTPGARDDLGFAHGARGREPVYPLDERYMAAYARGVSAANHPKMRGGEPPGLDGGHVTARGPAQ